MKKKINPCKLCDKKRYANLSICFSHYKERERIKRVEKANRIRERKISTKKYQLSEKKKWHKKCWVLMSEWVRRKDADWYGQIQCFTCPKVAHWKEMQAGHRYHRTLDFSEKNIKPQCTQCNMSGHGGRSGNLGEYEHHLIELHGLEWAKQLRSEAAQHQGYSLDELKRIYDDLKEKLSIL